MSSGMKDVQINSQERAMSIDINRLQKFKGADIAEMMRYMIDVQANDDLTAGGVVTEYATIETPMRAEIINGLLVRPQVGTLGLLVDPGVMFAIVPDGDPDSSNYKYIRDPGVSTNTLNMTANNSASTRIDIVEVQVATTIVETQTRDIFNPVTGLFTSTSVTKVIQDNVTTSGNIRIRLGTPGSGIPALMSGWLPLMIASIPAGIVTNDGMTFWDVRPLISDRAHGAFNLSRSRPKQLDGVIGSATTATTISASFDTVSIDGRRLGGRLRSGSPGPDSDVFDATAAANQEPGFAAVPHQTWYLYFLTALGLPRWARYTQTAPRLPRSPRGIAVVSTKAPDADGNPPTGGISLPTATGLATNTTTGVCVAAGYANVASILYPAFGELTSGYQLFNLADPPAGSAGGTEDPISFSGIGSMNLNTVRANYTITPGNQYPPCARALLLEFRLNATLTLNGAVSSTSTLRAILRVFGLAGGTQLTSQLLLSSAIHQPSEASVTLTVITPPQWIVLPSNYPSNVIPASLEMDLMVDLNGLSGLSAPTDIYGRILGWKF